MAFKVRNKYIMILIFMNFKTVISFCQTHPVDHYILKWQPPFVFVRGQSISILAKPVGRLEYRIIVCTTRLVLSTKSPAKQSINFL